MAIAKNSVMKSVMRVALPATAAAGILLPGTAAHAAYDARSCNGYRSCQTASIPSHSSQHWVRISGGSSGCIFSWKLRDTTNGVVVHSGNRTSGVLSWTTVYGLYASYRLEVSTGACNVNGGIRNYT
jgi:hypothetical protein